MHEEPECLALAGCAAVLAGLLWPECLPRADCTAVSAGLIWPEPHLQCDWCSAIYVRPLAPTPTQAAPLPLAPQPLQRLSRQIREAIKEQRYPAFVREYVARQFPAGDHPEWVVEGCRLAGIELGSSGTGGGPAAAYGAGGAAAAAAAAAAADGSREGGAAADGAG